MVAILKSYDIPYLSEALARVPQVSAISSTIMDVRLVTSPTNTIDSTSLAFLRCETRDVIGRFKDSYIVTSVYNHTHTMYKRTSLWMRANPMFSLSAIAVTLVSKIKKTKK